MDGRIIRFIKKHHVLTLCTQSAEELWCANCFYVYDARDNALVFTSDTETRHGREMLENPQVAGSIVLETKIIGKIRGLQFQGKAHLPEGDELKRIKTLYLKRFPVAMLMKTQLWRLDITTAKYTDNRLGFGKKLHYRRNDS